jgi:predicted nucleic acid-binding protein
MTAVLWDSWAFIETATDGPRSGDVAMLLGEAEGIFTTQYVVAETFTYFSRRSGSSRQAVAWWDHLRESRVRVLEPSTEVIHKFASGLKQVGTLSFTDLSIGAAAKAVGAHRVATADREFRRMRLEPLFAKS